MYVYVCAVMLIAAACTWMYVYLVIFKCMLAHACVFTCFSDLEQMFYYSSPRHSQHFEDRLMPERLYCEAYLDTYARAMIHTCVYMHWLTDIHTHIHIHLGLHREIVVCIVCVVIWVEK
jgi:hypothetical protein